MKHPELIERNATVLPFAEVGYVDEMIGSSLSESTVSVGPSPFALDNRSYVNQERKFGSVRHLPLASQSERVDL